jgi:hypothetical protein
MERQASSGQDKERDGRREGDLGQAVVFVCGEREVSKIAWKKPED